MKHIVLTNHETEKALVVTISREKALNALNHEVLEELGQVFDEINVTQTASIIITGAGQKAFAAGADIACIAAMTKAQGKEFSQLGSGIFCKIERCPVPVIAAVNGYALGGGLELALACDIRIASAGAVFGLPESGLGIIPGFGGTQRLMKIIAAGKAKEMIYTGERIKAAEALKLGLVNNVFEAEALMAEALALSGRIAASAADAVRRAKAAMNNNGSQNLKAGLELESMMFMECFEEAEQRKRMAKFLKR